MAPFSNCTIKKQSDSSAIWAGAGPRPEQDLKHQRMHTHDEPSQILSLFLLSLSERGTLQLQGHAGERARVPAQVPATAADPPGSAAATRGAISWPLRDWLRPLSER